VLAAFLAILRRFSPTHVFHRYLFSTTTKYVFFLISLGAGGRGRPSYKDATPPPA